MTLELEVPQGGILSLSCPLTFLNDITESRPRRVYHGLYADKQCTFEEYTTTAASPHNTGSNLWLVRVSERPQNSTWWECTCFAPWRNSYLLGCHLWPSHDMERSSQPGQLQHNPTFSESSCHKIRSWESLQKQWGLCEYKNWKWWVTCEQWKI